MEINYNSNSEQKQRSGIEEVLHFMQGRPINIGSFLSDITRPSHGVQGMNDAILSVFNAESHSGEPFEQTMPTFGQKARINVQFILPTSTSFTNDLMVCWTPSSSGTAISLFRRGSPPLAADVWFFYQYIYPSIEVTDPLIYLQTVVTSAQINIVGATAALNQTFQAGIITSVVVSNIPNTFDTLTPSTLEQYVRIKSSKVVVTTVLEGVSAIQPLQNVYDMENRYQSPQGDALGTVPNVTQTRSSQSIVLSVLGDPSYFPTAGSILMDITDSNGSVLNQFMNKLGQYQFDIFLALKKTPEQLKAQIVFYCNVVDTAGNPTQTLEYPIPVIWDEGNSTSVVQAFFRFQPPNIVHRVSIVMTDEGFTATQGHVTISQISGGSTSMVQPSIIFIIAGPSPNMQFSITGAYNYACIPGNQATQLVDALPSTPDNKYDFTVLQRLLLYLMNRYGFDCVASISNFRKLQMAMNTIAPRQHNHGYMKVDWKNIGRSMGRIAGKALPVVGALVPEAAPFTGAASNLNKMLGTKYGYMQTDQTYESEQDIQEKLVREGIEPNPGPTWNGPTSGRMPTFEEYVEYHQLGADKLLESQRAWIQYCLFYGSSLNPQDLLLRQGIEPNPGPIADLIRNLMMLETERGRVVPEQVRDALAKLNEEQVAVVAYYLNYCVGEGLIDANNMPAVIRVLIRNVLEQDTGRESGIPGARFFYCNIPEQEPLNDPAPYPMPRLNIERHACLNKLKGCQIFAKDEEKMMQHYYGCRFTKISACKYNSMGCRGTFYDVEACVDHESGCPYRHAKEKTKYPDVWYIEYNQRKAAQREQVPNDQVGSAFSDRDEEEVKEEEEPPIDPQSDDEWKVKPETQEETSNKIDPRLAMRASQIRQNEENEDQQLEILKRIKEEQESLRLAEELQQQEQFDLETLQQQERDSILYAQQLQEADEAEARRLNQEVRPPDQQIYERLIDDVQDQLIQLQEPVPEQRPEEGKEADEYNALQAQRDHAYEEIKQQVLGNYDTADNSDAQPEDYEAPPPEEFIYIDRFSIREMYNLDPDKAQSIIGTREVPTPMAKKGMAIDALKFVRDVVPELRASKLSKMRVAIIYSDELVLRQQNAVNGLGVLLRAMMEGNFQAGQTIPARQQSSNQLQARTSQADMQKRISRPNLQYDIDESETGQHVEGAGLDSFSEEEVRVRAEEQTRATFERVSQRFTPAPNGTRKGAIKLGKPAQHTNAIKQYHLMTNNLDDVLLESDEDDSQNQDFLEQVDYEETENQVYGEEDEDDGQASVYKDERPYGYNQPRQQQQQAIDRPMIDNQAYGDLPAYKSDGLSGITKRIPRRNNVMDGGGGVPIHSLFKSNKFELNTNAYCTRHCVAVTTNPRDKPIIVEVALSTNQNAKPSTAGSQMFEQTTEGGKHHLRVYGMDVPDENFFQDMELIVLHAMKVRSLTMPKHLIICVKGLKTNIPLQGRSMMMAVYAALMDLNEEYLYTGSLQVGVDIYAEGGMHTKTIKAKSMAIDGRVFTKLVVACTNAADLITSEPTVYATAFDLNPSVVLCTTPLIFNGLKAYQTPASKQIQPTSSEVQAKQREAEAEVRVKNQEKAYGIVLPEVTISDVQAWVRGDSARLDSTAKMIYAQASKPGSVGKFIPNVTAMKFLKGQTFSKLGNVANATQTVLDAQLNLAKYIFNLFTPVPINSVAQNLDIDEATTWFQETQDFVPRFKNNMVSLLVVKKAKDMTVPKAKKEKIVPDSMKQFKQVKQQEQVKAWQVFASHGVKPTGRLQKLYGKKVSQIRDQLIAMYGPPQYQTPAADDQQARREYDPDYAEAAPLPPPPRNAPPLSKPPVSQPKQSAKVVQFEAEDDYGDQENEIDVDEYQEVQPPRRPAVQNQQQRPQQQQSKGGKPGKGTGPPAQRSNVVGRAIVAGLGRRRENTDQWGMDN